MYKKLEKNLKEIFPEIKDDKDFKKTEIPIFLICTIIYIIYIYFNSFKQNDFYKYLFSIIFLNLLFLIYKIYNLYKPYYNKKDKTNILTKIIIAREKLTTTETIKFKNDLINVLKVYKINTREKLLLLIKHYKQLAIEQNKKRLFNKIIENISLFLPLVSLFSDNIKSEIISSITFLYMAIVVFISTFIYDCIKNYFNINKIFYYEIYDVLSNLYFKFEDYEDQLTS